MKQIGLFLQRPVARSILAFIGAAMAFDGDTRFFIANRTARAKAGAMVDLGTVFFALRPLSIFCGMSPDGIGTLQRKRRAL